MSVTADALTVHHDHQRGQRSLLEAAAAQVVLDYLNSGPRRAGVTLKTLCYNVLPANRHLLLKTVEQMAKRGLIQLRPSAGDILVRLAQEVRQ
jgi:hypothetical protein